MGLEYPDKLKYLDSHEYIALDGDTAVIGITAYAVDALGDIVFVELPEVGAEITKGDSCGSIESVKAVEDYYAPLGGEVLAVNTELEDAPETLNADPYEAGWIFKLKVADPSELDATLSAKEYQALVEG